MAEAAAPPFEDFDYEMSVRGWVKFPNVVPTAFCEQMRSDISGHIERCGAIQAGIGIQGAPDGTAHHTVGFDDSLDRFLEHGFLEPYVARYFGGPYILHAFNPVLIAPQQRNYVHRIHKDVRTHTGAFRMVLNMLVMVDEFTLDNGATHILSGSQHDPSPPTESCFHRHAERITGPQGSIVLFDSNVWHAAGENTSPRARAALTLSLSRPFLKPQMDYARLLGPTAGARLSPKLRQLLGYNARVATTLDEWYQPAGSRMYLPDQG